MSLSDRALQALNEHWAVAAIGQDELDRACDLAQQRLAQRAVGRQISFSFVESADDQPVLERVALAFELAAIEGLDELSRPAGTNQLLRDQAVAASFRAFDLRRLLPVPAETLERLFFVLQLSAIAYCGGPLAGLAAMVSGAGRGTFGSECGGCGLGPQAPVQTVRLLGPALSQRRVGRFRSYPPRSSPVCVMTRTFTRNVACKMVRRR